MGIWDDIISSEKEKSKADCPQYGKICPACKKGTLIYNGKLDLVCPECKIEYSAGFT